MSPLMILVSLVMKYFVVGDLRKTESLRTFEFLRGANSNSTAVQEPYKRITITNFKDSRKALIDGAVACISDQNCLSFIIDGDHLLMYKCSEEAFILKTRCPCESGKTYLRHLDLCFAVNTTHVSWVDAKDSCTINGGSLLVLDSKERYHGFLQAFDDPVTNANYFQLWVGARWVTNRLLWLNGNELPMDTPNWHFGEPNDPVNNFVLLGYYGWKWALDDHYPYSRFGFICEF